MDELKLWTFEIQVASGSLGSALAAALDAVEQANAAHPLDVGPCVRSVKIITSGGYTTKQRRPEVAGDCHIAWDCNPPALSGEESAPGEPKTAWMIEVINDRNGNCAMDADGNPVNTLHVMPVE